MNMERALLDRRAFLGWSFATAAVASAPGAALAQQSGTLFQRYVLPIGLQLYTVTDAARQDIEGTLKRIARICYRTIELAVPQPHEGTSLVVDGRVLGTLQAADRVRIVRSEARFKMVVVRGQSYYRRLREKLGWGGQLRINN